MRNLLLSTVTLLVVPAVAIAAPNFSSHIYTTPIELKPISSPSGIKLTSVCFLGYGDCGDVGFGSGDEDYTLDTAKQCLNEGYVKNNCNSVQTPTAYCPYNKSYISGCKCMDNLVSCSAGQVGVGDSCNGRYASCKCNPNLISCPSNKTGSGASCGGKYQSCVCKGEYRYTSSNCSYPKSVSGSSCDGKYTGCSCPSGVSSGSYGCKEYYPSPCSTVCKTAKTDNCDNRTSVSTPYGCAEYWSDCSTKCKTAYNDNCRNRTAVTCQYGCASYFGDCKSKCQTCGSNPDCNVSSKTCSYGCSAINSCNKCTACYTDNCRNRTAVNAPYGCQKYYVDCSSKCEIAAAEPACGIGSIYYSDGTCLPADKHDTSKIALGVVVHSTSNGQHGQVMAPWPVNKSGGKSSSLVAMHWAEGDAVEKDIPSLKNYDENGTERLSDFNSCDNTDIIVKTGGSSVYPAAWAARNYAPTAATKGKWCLFAGGIAVNIYENQEKIQKAISVLGGVAYPSCCCWTSTEYATQYNLGYYVGTSGFSVSYGLGRSGKGDYNSAYVYPVLEF